MAEFFHIMIKPDEKNPTSIHRSLIEERLNIALDWFRIDGHNYYIYTTSGKDAWYARLMDIVNPKGNLLIVEINLSNRTGFMPKIFWNWIAKYGL